MPSFVPTIHCDAIADYTAVTHSLGRHPDANFKASLAVNQWQEGLLIDVDYGAACPLAAVSEPSSGTLISRWRGSAFTLQMLSTPATTISVKVSTCLGGASIDPTVTCHEAAAPEPPPRPPPPLPPLPPSPPPRPTSVNVCAITGDYAPSWTSRSQQAASKFRFELAVSREYHHRMPAHAHPFDRLHLPPGSQLSHAPLPRASMLIRAQDGWWAR